MNRILTWLILLAPLWAGVLTTELEARAGGGGGYSGGGSSGGSGGGGGDGLGMIVYLVVRLVVVLWVDGGPVGKIVAVLLVVGLAFAAFKLQKHKAEQRNRMEHEGKLLTSRSQQRRAQQGLNVVRGHDPNFSRVLFLDFAHLLYVKYHESRGGMAARGESYAIDPFLAATVRERLKATPGTVHEVVVGGIEIARAWADQARCWIEVNYRANVVEEFQGKRRRMFYRHQFALARPLGVLTREPRKTLALGCPSCGSPAELRLDGTCSSCGTAVGGGELDWQIRRVEIRGREAVPESIAHGGVEQGTDLPTVFSPHLGAQKRELTQRDPAFNWVAFNRRVRHMFMEIQQGWTTLDESRIRPFETDTVFDAHRYWLARYREEGSRNVLEDIEVDRIEVARIEHDTWFDSIPVRIHARMKDYLLTAAGTIGSPSQRRFSEYWTLVRSAGKSSNPRAEPAQCPSCGAGLDKVNRSGVCGYCGSRIVSGEFEWVLAIIEQDEEYRG